MTKLRNIVFIDPILGKTREKQIGPLLVCCNYFKTAFDLSDLIGALLLICFYIMTSRNIMSLRIDNTAPYCQSISVFHVYCKVGLVLTIDSN